MDRLIWLSLLFVVTRNHAWTSSLHLPDASLATFFLAGLWLTGFWPPLVLLALGVGVDAWAITAGGVSAYCVTPAYGFLLPASAALWWAGRLNQKNTLSRMPDWLQVGLMSVASTVLAELLSSGGFYFFSGRFPHPSLSGLMPRLLHYSPSVVGATLGYVVLGLLIERQFTALRPNSILKRSIITEQH